MPVRTAVIPAAGLGTRFLPATKVVPKELLPVFDTPSLQHTVDEAIGAGIDHIILVSNRAKPAIEAFADKASGGARITVVYQDAPAGWAMPWKSRASWSATHRLQCCCPTS